MQESQAKNQTLITSIIDEKFSFQIFSEALPYCTMLRLNDNCQKNYNQIRFYFDGVINTLTPIKYIPKILEVFNNRSKFDINKINNFDVKNNKNFLKLKVPPWRPDIVQEIDVIEELMRIYGYDKIKKIEPVKVRKKPTLNRSQKLFHFLQRAVASKGYQEAITWSFTDSKVNDFFKSNHKNIEIINPISSDLNVLRNSIFSNLILYLNKNLNRDFFKRRLK